MIQWTNVSYQRSSRFLLRDISVTLPTGKLTVIMGPNGAGKSTFLRLCSRELQPTLGDLTLHGRNLKAWSSEELALFRGVLSQSLPMTFPMTVTELALMGRYPHQKKRAPSAADPAIVAAALNSCSLSALKDRSTQHLSGGEMQRAHMARVLAQIWEPQDGRPRILLLDEPTASLDPTYQHLCLLRARQLTEEGVSVVAILHDLNLAARYADHIVFLKEGRLAAAGTMPEMMQQSILEDVFSVHVRVLRDPRLSHPLIVTLGPQTSSPVLLRSLSCPQRF
jgi:iron complex transport system ATP-binding protein